MSIAELIYQKVASLPKQAANEVLDFADFLATRHSDVRQQEAGRQDAAAFYARFQADLSGHRFNRDEANARLSAPRLARTELGCIVCG